MPVILQFLTTAIAIIIAGTYLTRFADEIAEKTGLGRLLVGSIFLALATSIPEMTVVFNAVTIGEPDLAAGDLLGSGLFNLFNFLMLSAIFRLPKAISMQHEQNALAILGIALASIIALGMLANSELSFLGAGIFPWIAFFCYGLGIWLLYKRTKAPIGVKQQDNGVSIVKAGTGYILSAAVIIFAAHYLTDAADKIAVTSGLGHSFIGTTLVAISTTLPELATTIAAFRMRNMDLALGNVFGSNLFNLALFLPLDLYYAPNILRDISDINVVTAVGLIFSTSLTIMVLLYAPTQKKTILIVNGLVAASIIVILLLLYMAGNSQIV